MALMPRADGALAGSPSAQPPRAGLLARLRGWRQWPRDTRDTLFQLLVIAWTVLPHTGHLPAWCSVLTAAVLAWRARLALLGGPLPGRWPVLAVLLLAVGLTAWQERGLLGREAGVTMLVLLMALKTLELRARRDAMVVFFLGFFLVLTHCLYSQSLLTALAMLVSAQGLLTALVLANMPVGRPPLATAAAVALRAGLLGLPLMAALFLLFPRLGPLWGTPADGAGRTGLSGTLRLGGVAQLANDEAVALRVRFEPGQAAPPAEALYFRGPVLSRFDGLEWAQSFRALTRPGAGLAGTAQPPGPALQLQGRPVAYTLLLEPSRLPLLPLLEITPALPGAAPQLADPGALGAVWQGPDAQWHTERPVLERQQLQARAWPRYQLGAELDAYERLQLTLLPEGRNPRARLWARQLRDTLPGADARTLAQALLAQIRQGGYIYTLQPGNYGADAVDEFWFDRREGFCEHFAASFVVLMRAMGVPARLVTGYQGAEPPDADGWRIVRQSHAHAWAEWWQPGAGWQRADPTAAVAPERVRASRPLPVPPGLVDGALRSVSPALAAQIRRAWELLDSRWTQWVMGYSRAQQFNLLERLGFSQPDWADLLRLLAGGLAALAAGAGLWAWWDRHRLPPWQRLQRRLLDRLQAIGVPAGPADSPRRLAQRVRARHGAAGQALAALLEDLERQRYAPGGSRLPAPGWWPALRRASRGLRG